MSLFEINSKQKPQINIFLSLNEGDISEKIVKNTKKSIV